MKKIDKKIINEARELRKNGSSLDEISKHLKIDRETTTKYTKDIILTRQQQYKMRSESASKYEYNSSVFTNANEISYYLLGAFITDGHISKYRNSATLTSKDLDWIQDIGKIICADKPIYQMKKSNAYTFSFNNFDSIQWLISNQCKPAKSLTVEFPNIPNKYLIDFIRGCFDGDGCLCIYKDKTRKYHNAYSYISSASEKFILEFSKQLKNIGINSTINKIKLCNSVIDGRKIIAKHNLFRLHLNQTETYKLCKIIYYDNCLCLKRKQQKSNEIISLCESNSKFMNRISPLRWS